MCFFVHNFSVNKDKFDHQSIKCVFFGYSRTKKEYKCFDPVS